MRGVIGREQALGPFPLTAKIYYALFGSDHFGLRVRARHLVRLLHGLEPRRILDAGCSRGVYSFYLSRRYPSALVCGIDIDIVKLHDADSIRHRLGKRGKCITFQKCDLTVFQTDVPFDFICCIDVLEHVLDDEQALKCLKTALSVEGILLLHVPQKNQLNRYVLANFSPRGISEGHIREYTEEDILAKVKRAGFEVKKLRYTFGWAGSIAREIYYKLEEIPLALIRAVLKGILAPLLLLLAYFDTLTANRTRFQGFFLLAFPLRESRTKE